MKKILKLISLSILFPCFLFSQTGNLNDPSFNVFDHGFIQGYVNDFCFQPDGKLLVGGQFSNCSSPGILRLNNNGGIDSTFIAANLFYNVNSIALQADGKILIGGGAGLLKRLNSDGSVDPSFNLINFNNVINAIAIQGDGKIIVGGMFTTVNLIPKNCIVRLNTDGSIDNTFNIGSGFYNTSGTTVNSIAIQSNGKIVVGGLFISYNGQSSGCIARVNTDGSLDNTFLPSATGGMGFNNVVNTILIQSDGKLLVGGMFNSANGTVKNSIARLNTDGTLDIPFNSGTGFNGGSVNTISLQSDGKLIVGGNFTSYNGTSNNRISRLNSDGTIDGTFNLASGFDDAVKASIIAANGSIYVGGYFTKYKGVNCYYISKLYSDGNIETFLGGIISAIKLQTDGKIVLGGSFKNYNGVLRNGIVRLNNDGLVDTSFNPLQGFNGHVNSLAIQSDGKILAGGFFSTYNGIACSNIVRINSDGSLDLSFGYGTGFNNQVNTISIQTDGKIIVGGSFTSYNGSTVNRIARLNTNGAVDPTFIYGNGFNNTVNTTEIQSNGRILVGGNFTTYNGSVRNYIIRLTSNGGWDNTFSTGTGFNLEVKSIKIQTDGKILVGGNFTTYNGSTITKCARLNTNGSLDLTFAPPSTLGSEVSCISIQTDGKIVIAGRFNPSRIYRLNTDGSIDGSFNYGSGFNQFVNASCIQTDGKILLGGGFTCFDGVTKSKMVRLLPCVAPSALISLVGSTTICQGNTVTLNVPSGVGLTYQWQNNGINISGATSSSYSANASGNYTAVVTSNGCSSTSIPASVTINPLPNINISSSGSTTVCIGASLTLTASGANSFSWNNSILNGVAFAPQSTMVYTVIGTDVNGCTNTNQVTVTVNPLPSVNAGQDQSLCQGDMLTLSGSGANNYSWTNSVQNNIPFTPTASQTYTVTGTDNNNCSNTDQVTVTVNPLPSVNAGQDQIVCQGDMVTLAGSGANNYSWTNNVQNNVPFSPQTTQTYTVSGTDNNNCSATDNVIVTVNMNSSATQTQSALDSYTWPVNGQIYSQSGIYTAIIPNAQGCDSTITLNLTLSYTGIEEVVEDVKIYPNPTNSSITIEGQFLLGKEILIVDSQGRELFKKKLNEAKDQFDLSSFADGIYYLTMDKNTKVFKIVKH